MRMDKLTSRFQQALADAQSLAVGRDHNMLEPAHLMAALLDQQGGSTVPLLAQAGANVPALRTRIGQILDRLPKVAGQGRPHHARTAHHARLAFFCGKSTSRAVLDEGLESTHFRRKIPDLSG